MAGTMLQLPSVGLSSSALVGGEDDQQMQSVECAPDVLWRDFFKDPLMWWGNRSSKRSTKLPDFQHKVTKEPLWICSQDNPSWVKDKHTHCELASEHDVGTAGTPSALLPSLWACCKNKDLFRGIRIHAELQKKGLVEKEYSDALVTMYAKCGELQKAQALLDIYSSSNVIPWNSLIASYARERQGQKALNCFDQMQHEGISPDAVTYVSVLKACAVMGAIDKGNHIHEEVSKQGLLEHHIVLGGALVDMYSKCGALPQAQSVLEKLPSRNLISWSALIGGYARKGQGKEALECFQQMQREGIRPDAVTYACILKACAMVGAIDKGKQIHDDILRQGLLKHNKVLGGALVDMYAKCGALPQAQSVIEKLPTSDAFSWSSLIAGYAQNGHSQQALECLEQMRRNGILPDAVTYVCILKAFALNGELDKGKQIHDEISRQGLLKDNVVLGGALVDMYAKCGALSQAQKVLENLPMRNVVLWNALITGFVEEDRGEEALECLEKMQYEGIIPNEVTYLCILKSCGMIRAIDKGKQIHDEILRQGWLQHDVMLGNALVDMYAKCGALQHARCVLEKLPSPDVISWNSLIAGYSENGQGQQALDCLEEMRHEGISPDAVTYVSVLKLCAVDRAIDKGKQIHDEVSQRGILEKNLVLGAALVDMYVKCGAIPQAQSVLKKLPLRDAISWNGLIAGYAQECDEEQALLCYEEMQHEGIRPDMVTFRCLLSLCSHLGLVEKGQELFDDMGAKYGLKPDVECFTCMVDLLGRAGHLVKAVELIHKMPYPVNSAVLRCLLGSCQKWVDVSVGAWAFEQAVELDKCDGAAYALMFNIYAAAGMAKNAKDIEAMRIKNKAWNH